MHSLADNYVIMVHMFVYLYLGLTSGAITGIAVGASLTFVFVSTCIAFRECIRNPKRPTTLQQPPQENVQLVL
jgi:hypothetical protein